MEKELVFIESEGSYPLQFDLEKCIGCKRCIESCQVDVLLPPAENEKVPRVAYPGECWYCGCCVMDCPVEGAIRLRHPLMNQVRWVEKSSLYKNGRVEE